MDSIIPETGIIDLDTLGKMIGVAPKLIEEKIRKKHVAVMQFGTRYKHKIVSLGAIVRVLDEPVN